MSRLFSGKIDHFFFRVLATTIAHTPARAKPHEFKQFSLTGLLNVSYEAGLQRRRLAGQGPNFGAAIYAF
jgi:hypothetical protein